MVKWIVLVVVLLGLAVLALAVRAVLIRLPRLQRAALALQERQAQAESLRGSAADLQERLMSVQQQVDNAQRRFALIKAKRDE